MSFEATGMILVFKMATFLEVEMTDVTPWHHDFKFFFGLLP